MRPIDLLREKVLFELLAEKNTIILELHQELETARAHIERCQAKERASGQEGPPCEEKV